MKKINQIYADADYEMRLKAPVLSIFLLFLSSMVGLLTLIQFTDGFNVVDFLTNAFIISLFLGSWIILKRGNYPAASAVFMFGVVFLIGLSNTVDGYTGENAFAQRMLIYVSIYLLAIFFTARFTHLLIVLVIGTVMLAANTGYLIVTRGYTELSVSLGGQLMTSLTLYVIAVAFSLLFRRTIDRVIADANGKTLEAEKRAEHMGRLAGEARDGLDIARTMEEQAEETASSIIQIEENVNGISNNVEMLTGQFDNSRNALEQIGENMTSLENVAADQSANITETGAALEEMVASINSVSQVIENKMRSVDKLHESADQGAQVIGETSDSFKQVLEHLENVKKMITMISSIAAQTNLLAMNAAIEAAHAGDAGRGFAVVADEVRKLAESSGVNAKQVGVTLKQLVDAIETTGTNVNNSGTTFSVISNEVRLVGDAMKEINNSVQELAAGSGEVLKATTSMNSLTGKVSENVSDVRAQEETAQKSLKKLGDFIINLGSSMGEIRVGTTHIRESSLELQGKSGQINEFVKEFGSKLGKS